MRYHPSQRNIVWTVLFSIFLVVTLNACGDANNVSGPPALSPDAQLSNLTVNTGPLDPTFSSDVANYSVDVGTSITSVTMTARAQNTGATVSINGQTTTSRSVPLGIAGSNTPIPIVVTAVSGSQNTYIVTVNRAAPGGDNNLSALSVTGQTLAPPFSAGQLSYTVNVATTVASVEVTARKSDPNAVMSGSVTAGGGQATGQATIPLGGAPSSTIVSIIVTAPNESRNAYIVNVSRAAPGGNNNLQSLTVSPGTLVPGFMAGTTSYTVSVADDVPSVTVTAQADDAGATVSINGQPGGSQSVQLEAAGTTTFISIDVRAPNGFPKRYDMRVNRAAMVPAPTIMTTALPNATVGQDYSLQLAVTGGIAPLTWTIVPGSGSLPDMFDLTPGGQILGSPIRAGAPSAFTVEVTDARGRSDTQPLSIEIFNSP